MPPPQKSRIPLDYIWKETPPSEWPSGIYYGDGSGGEYTKYPALRRCGVGVCTLHDGVFWFGGHTRLPGEAQTVPRAENCALGIVLDKVEFGASIEFITDSKLLFDQLSKGRDKAKDSINADQFLRFSK